MANTSVQDVRRMRAILREAVDRFNHELMMDDAERQLLLDRIKRLRRRLEKAEAI